MAASTLGSLLDRNTKINVDLPEWDMYFDEALHLKIKNDSENTIKITDLNSKSIIDLIELIRLNNKSFVLFEGWFQRHELYYGADFYRKIFPIKLDEEIFFSEDEIVISVRAGEIRRGIGWYPLVPPHFYLELIKRTQYKPVFLGQLDECPYWNEIRSLFPDARIIASAGAMVDFNRLRKAHKICLSVSTFSWVAAYLSEATEIHFPLLGFLHPQCLDGIDLAPLTDPRYRYHLLPILRGVPEIQYLRHVKKITPISKEVPTEYVHVLRSRAPIIEFDHTKTVVDDEWYISTYIDAAWEISEGWYKNAAHHYEKIGRQRGNKRFFTPYQPKCQNIALDKPATQSSLSVWSIGTTKEKDAANAVDGNSEKEIAFHTDVEANPWWMVDLMQSYSIECVQIYNRKSYEFIRKRASPLVIEISENGVDWVQVDSTHEFFDFGCERGHGPNVPYQWRPEILTVANKVRIRLPKENEVLHLAAVEIFGTFFGSNNAAFQTESCGT